MSHVIQITGPTETEAPAYKCFTFYADEVLKDPRDNRAQEGKLMTISAFRRASAAMVGRPYTSAGTQERSALVRLNSEHGSKLETVSRPSRTTSRKESAGSC